MNTRIKELRKAKKLSQEKFGERLGMSRDQINNVENGRAAVTEFLIKAICREFKVNEIWLRTGDGEPFDNDVSREVEMTELFAELMSDRPEAFRTRLVTTLLRFRPDGPEWAILEKIYENIKKEADAMEAEAKEKETDS